MKMKRPASFSLRCTVTQSNSRPSSAAFARGRARRFGVFVEPFVDEPGVELLVAVGEQRHEVVDARAEQRVLEVDPRELERLALPGDHHEVAALVVAVHEAARPAGDAGREPPGDRFERLRDLPRAMAMPRARTPHSRKWSSSQRKRS